MRSFQLSPTFLVPSVLLAASFLCAGSAKAESDASEQEGQEPEEASSPMDGIDGSGLSDIGSGADESPSESVAPPVASQEQAEEPEAKKEKKPVKLRKLKTVQLPAFGNTQPWLRFTHFVDYFGNNYDPQPNNDTFMGFVNFMNFGTDTRFKKWKLSTLARVDTQNLVNTQGPSLCDQNGDGQISSNESTTCSLGSDARLERLSIRADFKKLKLTVGDFNVNFGRGLPLSIRKINDISPIDPTIKGGRVDIRTKPVQITGIFGVANRQQSDYATRRLIPDPGYSHVLCDNVAKGFEVFNRNRYGNRLWTSCSDIIGGVRAEGKLPGKVRVGAHYANIWFGRDLAGYHEAMHIVGGDIARTRIAKHWDFFGGMTTLLRNYHLGETRPDLKESGYGVYLQNNIYFGDTSIVLEGKYYDNYVVGEQIGPLTAQYTEAPTLEREDQQFPANANAAGGRIRIDHTIRKYGITPYVNVLGYAYALANDNCLFGTGGSEGQWGGSLAELGRGDGTCSSGGLMVWHPYAGVNWRNTEKGTELRVSGGYRWEGFQRESFAAKTGTEGITQFQRKFPHAEIYYTQALGKWGGFGHSLTTRFEWRNEQQWKSNKAINFHRGVFILGYNLAPYVNFSFIGGYSSEFPALEGGLQLHDQVCGGASDDCIRKPHFWPGAEVRVNFLASSFVRVFVGRQVGGLLCVNGSCRIVPDFEGARMDLVLSF